ADQSAGAERIESLRKEAFDFSSSDRIGVIVSRAFELLSALTKSRGNTQSVQNAIVSLELEQSFALTKDNRKDEPTRHLIYGLCESLIIATKSMSDKETPNEPIQRLQSCMNGRGEIKQEYSDEDSYDVTDSGSQEVMGDEIDEAAQGQFADQSPIGFLDRQRPEDLQAFVADQAMLANAIEALKVPKEEEPDEMPPLFRATTGNERRLKEEECDTQDDSDANGMNACWSDVDDQPPLLSSISAQESGHGSNKHLSRHFYKSKRVRKLSSVKQKTCRDCKRAFLSERARRDHVCRPVFHDPFKTYPCTMCGCQFSSKYAQRTHLKNIHGRMEFMCTKCGADFQLKRDLREHEMTHMTAKSRAAEVDQQFKT
ncbi:hypothetical protein PFISCL1PPCAC_907, partial [Pristionchus fissidentatus]